MFIFVFTIYVILDIWIHIYNIKMLVVLERSGKVSVASSLSHHRRTAFEAMAAALFKVQPAAVKTLKMAWQQPPSAHSNLYSLCH